MSKLIPYQKYLLVIDKAPLDKKFQDYFTQFGFQIIQKSKLTQRPNDLKPLAAILINWSLIQAESMIINELYQQCSIPIIIISDASNEEICVRLLEAGADDFLTKPLHPRELHARICAITRRVERTHQSINNEKEVLLFANWRLYPISRQLFNGDDERQLSTKEYDLLLAFVRQPQRILDRYFLSHSIQSSVRNALDRRIDVQICRLRQKIEVDAKKPLLIKTIRNNGYLFTARVLSTKE